MSTGPLSNLVAGFMQCLIIGNGKQHIEQLNQACRAISNNDLTSPPLQRRQTQKATRLPWQKQLGAAQLESTTKASKDGRQTNPIACLKRAQNLSLAEQTLPPAVQCRLDGRLQFSAGEAPMPRNAWLHQARSRKCAHGICERIAFASTRSTKLCGKCHAAADQAVVTALVPCSASNFSIHGHKTPLTFWLRPASCSAWCLADDKRHIEEQNPARRTMSNHDLT